jgi:hypothetical protein
MNTKDDNRIEDYLYGRMSAEEQRSFEADTQTDSELKEETQLAKMEQQALQLLAEQELRRSMKDWKAEKNTTEAKVVSLNRRRMFTRLAAAASVLLLIGLPLFWANQNYSSSALSVEGLAVNATADRGNIPPENPMGEALQLYAEEGAAEAQAFLGTLSGTAFENQARLLSAKIQAQTGAYEEAIEDAQAITGAESVDMLLRQEAEWVLANVYLAMGEDAEAKARLSRIAAQPTHLKQKEATELLQRLESVWRTFVF